MPHKPLYFSVVRVFFSTHLAEGQQLEPSFLALHWLQLSVDWNNIIASLRLLLIPRNISTISSPSPSPSSIHHYRKHEISPLVLSLLSTRLQQPHSFLSRQVPLLCSLAWTQLGRDYRHNHQSLSTNGASWLAPWSLPNYSRATFPTNTLTITVRGGVKKPEEK